MTDTTTPQAQWSVTVTPVIAAITTLCASSALAGVIEGMRWLGYAGIAVMVVTATGLGLRALRTPTLVVGLAQMAALMCLVVALFTNSGILGVFPGPSAIEELGEVLRRSVEAVQLGVPPVPATAPMLCLVVIAIGLVAVLVDTLAVSAGAPAACGLVLLCVYAVPASLADDLLPWWSFILGATSFAFLLAVDGAHRHQQWRNRPALPGTAAGFGSPSAMVSVALVMGLLAGALITGIGTVGSLPGGSGGKGGGGGLALKPFTALRGMLDQGTNIELYRVRNLGNEARYLRAMTLPRYDRNGGWTAVDALPDDYPADADLPPAPGDDGGGTITRIEIEPINSPKDLWAPVYGTPRRLRDIPKGMFYDQSGGMVYSRTPRQLGKYTEDADMSQPAREDLRLAGNDFSEIDQIYLTADGIDPEVVALAKQITAGKPTMFDKALALQQYFDRANGFEYKTQTDATSDENALKDFLFRSKVGYCEQYASAMAILARAVNIPSRVAIGYTAGFQSGDYRSITTQDAHAWVEVFFPAQGWVTFDPTPLTDGRTFVPPYTTGDPSAGPETSVTEEEVPTGAPSTSAAPREDPVNEQDPDAIDSFAGQEDTSWPWQIWAGLIGLVLTAAAVVAARVRRSLVRFAVPVVAVLATLTLFFLVAAVSWWLAALVLVLVAAAVPALVRAWWRHGRRHAVVTASPAAASAAWDELMAESWDRGATISDSDTVRTAARRLAREHSLDEPGKTALRTVVNSVERSWYGGQAERDPELAKAFDEVIVGLRRTAPLAWKARLLPRSVMRPRR
ncbi:transglutaminaseTgpA domain-containing protein [Actinokineospora sp. HUAS TT18]|uniref:transglutaminase family protein n=1 Tax=Actinokineospora sp. HUAS TT18 TaxID=3447451 RepID=UPI003F5210C6